MHAQGRSQEFILTEAKGLMASAGARAYNGGLGAEPPAGSRGRAPGQGAKPPEAESFLLSDVQRTEQICTFAVFSAIHYNKIERCKIRAVNPQ